MARTIAALFDTTKAAERAAYDLAARVGGARGEVYGSSRTGELAALLIPRDDAAALHEHVRRSGAVLHAEVPDDRFEAAADALEAAGAANPDEREAAWRREGWTGAAAAATASHRQNDFGTSPAAAAKGTGGGEERIPVVEERLRVGKRETAHGRVRIRSYVVEAPVQEQVTLREEHVRVERRPADRPVAAGDDAFRERTVEATESAEEAVVSKEARVTEEVVVRKHSEERTETVSDTVRRTEVEVEDGRGRPDGAPRPDTG